MRRSNTCLFDAVGCPKIVTRRPATSGGVMGELSLLRTLRRASSYQLHWMSGMSGGENVKRPRHRPEFHIVTRVTPRKMVSTPSGAEVGVLRLHLTAMRAEKATTGASAHGLGLKRATFRQPQANRRTPTIAVSIARLVGMVTCGAG